MEFIASYSMFSSCMLILRISLPLQGRQATHLFGNCSPLIILSLLGVKVGSSKFPSCSGLFASNLFPSVGAWNHFRVQPRTMLLVAMLFLSSIELFDISRRTFLINPSYLDPFNNFDQMSHGVSESDVLSPPSRPNREVSLLPEGVFHEQSSGVPNDVRKWIEHETIIAGEFLQVMTTYTRVVRGSLCRGRAWKSNAF